MTSVLTAAAAVAAAGSVGLLGAPIATADDLTTTTIGNEAKLIDGNVVQGWTITDLKASTDPIPYPVAGTLWEATATDQAIEGSATPIVSNLNARARSGQTYRVLFGVATPQGVNPSTLAQGQKTSGKVYFDVVGDSPDSVVYDAGVQDLLVWVQPPPQLPSRNGGGGHSSTSPAAPATAATPVPPGAIPGAPATLEGTPGAPAPGAALPTGSAGTPIPAGSQGTPLTPGSQGTPLPTGSSGTPVAPEGSPQPAAVQQSPASAGSQGTPLPASGPAAPAPGATVAPGAAPAPALGAAPGPTAAAVPSSTVLVPPPAA